MEKFMWLAIGLAVGAIVAGSWIPFGDEQESIMDKLMKKEG